MSGDIEPRRTPTDHMHGNRRHDHPGGDRPHDHIQQSSPGVMQVVPKSPAVAVALSFLIPGLGSMTSGEAGMGVFILVCYVFAWASALFLIGFILAPAVWIWGMVAAHGAARRWNYRHGILS